MKIVVTGGTGFLGKALMPKLKAAGHEVVSCSKGEGIDIRNFDAFKDFLDAEKPELVVHCAAHVGGIGYNALHPVEIFEDNVHIGLNLIKACHASGVKKVLNVVPNCVYPGKLGEYEESLLWDGAVHESILSYAMPRRLLWGACLSYCKQDADFRPVHLIFPNMYGPNDHFEPIRSHALGALLKKIMEAQKNGDETIEIWGSGKPIREWLYVEDGADSIVKSISRFDSFSANDVMNIGVTKGVSISELAEMIKEKAGWTGSFTYATDKPDGAMKKILIAEKMKKILEWEPPTSLPDGISETVAWYRKEFS